MSAKNRQKHAGTKGEITARVPKAVQVLPSHSPEYWVAIHRLLAHQAGGNAPLLALNLTAEAYQEAGRPKAARLLRQQLGSINRYRAASA